MSAENVARTIQLILAQVVLITACAIVLGGLLGRYDAINTRVRMMGHERLDLLHKSQGRDALDAERLREIDRQVPDLLHRYRMQHDAITTIYGAIVVFLINMFVIALAIGVAADWAARIALLNFLVGTAIVMVGVFRAAHEIRISQRALNDELSQIEALPVSVNAGQPQKSE